MMTSPEAFKQMCKDKTLEECYQVRRTLIDDICRYEDGFCRESRILPSPKTIYDMNNLYLKEICDLIEEKLEERRYAEDETDITENK